MEIKLAAGNIIPCKANAVYNMVFHSENQAVINEIRGWSFFRSCRAQTCGETQTSRRPRFAAPVCVAGQPRGSASRHRKDKRTITCCEGLRRVPSNRCRYGLRPLRVRFPRPWQRCVSSYGTMTAPVRGRGRIRPSSRDYISPRSDPGTPRDQSRRPCCRGCARRA